MLGLAALACIFVSRIYAYPLFQSELPNGLPPAFLSFLVVDSGALTVIAVAGASVPGAPGVGHVSNSGGGARNAFGKPASDGLRWHVNDAAAAQASLSRPMATRGPERCALRILTAMDLPTAKSSGIPAASGSPGRPRCGPPKSRIQGNQAPCRPRRRHRTPASKPT